MSDNDSAAQVGISLYENNGSGEENKEQQQKKDNTPRRLETEDNSEDEDISGEQKTPCVGCLERFLSNGERVQCVLGPRESCEECMRRKRGCK